MKADTTLALFDFDKTLYKKDSLIEFTKFSQGNLRFYLGLLYLSPYLILMKSGILSNKNVKQKYITYFFKSIEYDCFKKIATDFAVQEIERNLNPEIYEKFLMHINAKHQVFIVTASIPEWIEPWSQKFGVKVIGSNWEIADNKITGKLATENCYGKEKVNRINETLDLEKFDKIYVYGSGKGDSEMLQLFKE
ncbi:MAG TPA: HAD-IB family hydrolase [Flavobacterium sp.]|uniref:HAD-IB family hydrolase n=1 Tax=Flavobacterium sp. TaxID=239 RepID=UPI002ED5AFCA